MSQTIELDEILGRLMLIHPDSREGMKAMITQFLGDKLINLDDKHNTTSMIFVFKADGKTYGLKIEYGTAQVTRDEAHWYELAPVELKPHFVVSHVSDSYAFVLLRWLEQAKTIEEIAIENEGNSDNPTIELVLQVLKQNQALFDSASTIPLLVGPETSYFYDKYLTYNAQAKNYPYLQALIELDTIRINGREMFGPNRFVDVIQKNDELRAYLSPTRAGLILGDAHSENVLVQDGRVYFIDPKGVDHLPLEYDTGRVFWSLTGWNATNMGEFTLSNDADGYHIEVKRRQQYVDGLPLIREYLGEHGYHRAMYSAALQYLTRVSHAAVEPEATAHYLRGLETLAELFDELKQPIL